LDDGDHWQSLQQNLPATSVRDITIHDADVVIATHGRGFWILDDVSALRQLDAKVENAAAWLFAPAVAYRVRRPAFAGTPLPKDEPMVANPPDGATIDYTLKAASREPVTLDILDAAGGSVRHYSSADQPKAPDLAKLETAPEWIKPQSTLSAAPGMHRFVWPLHYPAPLVAGKHDAFADGIWAPPGKYVVALSVDGQRLTQPLTLAADPRVKLAAEVYAQQFDLARRVEQMHTKVAAAINEADKLLEQLSALHGAEGAPVRDIDALSQRAHAIAGTSAAANPYNAWAFPPRSMRSLHFVAATLDKFEQAIDGSDAAPSPDARQGVEKLEPLADASVQDWDALKAQGLAALNAKLQAAGRKPIALTDSASNMK
jgi:hypothetical protein